MAKWAFPACSKGPDNSRKYSPFAKTGDELRQTKGVPEDQNTLVCHGCFNHSI